MEDHVQAEGKIETIVRSYPQLGSHDYLIFRDEAKAESFMGDQIAPENQVEEDLIWRLYEDYRNDMDLGRQYVPAILVADTKAAGGPLPVKISQKIVVIESTARSDLWRRDIVLSERVVPSPTGPMPMTYQEITYNGWS